MPKVIEGKLSAEGLKIALVVSRFNSFITDRLLEGAVDTLRRLGANPDDAAVVKVPGSFELTVAAKKLVESKKYDGIVCLGAIIRGETPHFEHVSAQTARGIATLSLQSGIPVTFGVITAEDLQQAVERSGSKHGNKGSEAVMSVVEMVNVIKQL
ncbi:MAG: 6,7-dimethyl-8-ribityllumazine synthase [Pseudomonadota bacterium]